MVTTHNPNEPAGTCPACKARDPEYGIICEPCRRWTGTALHSIPAMYARLPHFTAAGSTGSTKAPRVSGTRERSVPVNLQVLDLLGPVARNGGIPVDSTRDTMIPTLRTTPMRVTVREGYTADGTPRTRETTMLDRQPAIDHNGAPILAPAGDQTGAIPVAQVLDQEARAWIAAGAPGSRWRPTPIVPTLATWLTNRLPWACDRYEPFGDFTATLSRLRGQLRGALGEFDADPEPCYGIACRSCDMLALQRVPGSEYIECGACEALLTEDEYREWVGLLAGAATSRAA
jgi:hypothetical protein